MLVIGSRANDLYLPLRRGADLDLVGTYEDLQEVTTTYRRVRRDLLSIPTSKKKTVLIAKHMSPVEFEIAWPGSTAEELLERAPKAGWLKRDPLSLHVPSCDVPTLDVLYTLKMSHRYLRNSTHFHKTRHDIRQMRKAGAKIWDAAWLKRREVETYDYDHPKLDTTKGDFFKVGAGSRVQYIFDHDSIHESVARFVAAGGPGLGTPAYTLYKGGGEVMCDREKFFSLPRDLQLRGVLEEAYVLALERSQIPYGHHTQMPYGHHTCTDRKCVIGGIRRSWNIASQQIAPTPRQSFEIALEKVCTSITSGWFREFAWENYDDVEALFDMAYTSSFWADVIDGRVKTNTPPTGKRWGGLAAGWIDTTEERA